MAKFALSVPPPSCASAFTESLALPPRLKLFSWKLPLRLVEAGDVEDVVDAVVEVEEVLHRDGAVAVVAGAATVLHTS